MLSQSKPTNIAIVTSITGAKSFSMAMDEIKKEYGNIIDLKLYYVDDMVIEDVVSLKNFEIVWLDIRNDVSNVELIKNVLSNADNIVLGFSMGNIFGIGPIWLDREQSPSQQRIISWMRKRMEDMAGWNEKDFDMSKMQGMMKIMMKITGIIGKIPFKFFKEISRRTTVMEYWLYGGKENTKNLLLYLVKEYGGQKVRLKPPQEYFESGIYHPITRETFSSLKNYLERYGKTKEQTVGLLLLGGSNLEDSIVGASEIMRRLEDEVNFIPIYSQNFRYPEAIQDFFFLDGKPIVDTVVSFLLFRMNGGPIGGDPKLTLDVLKKLDVPVINASPMYLEETQRWQESERGLSPIEVIMQVILPELDGCIEPIPSCGYANSGFDPNIGGNLKAMTPIPDRLDRIAGRVEGWLRLRRKKNAEKRVAIILYNYPPDESGIGAAGCLNTIKSVEKVLRTLKDEGYTTDDLQNLDNLFIDKGILNAGTWLSKDVTAKNSILIENDDYLKWLESLPERAKEELLERWGNPPGDILTYEGRIIIPGIVLGNVFIGLQPSHGGDYQDIKRSLELYHDKTIPPHHQYLAFYKWIQEEFKADAIVHLGTHGTLEFTKGKEVGMSRECFPDILIGDIPNIYVYMVSNPSEASIAKRRSYATMISHLPPIFTDSGLYDELAELEELIHEYNEARLQDPNRAKIVRDQILEKSKEANIEEKDIDKIYDELFAIKRSIIPKGLHTFGETYEYESLVDFITFVLRYDRGEIKSLHRLLASLKGIDYDRMMQEQGNTIDNKPYAEVIVEIEDISKKTVSILIKDGIEEAIKHLKIFKKENQESIDDLEKSLTFGLEIASNLKKSDEIESLLKALSGRYIIPNIGGDPIRSPEVFPTGSNIYQFDPRLVPSDAAYMRGAKIADETLKHYKQMHNSYPQSVGLILWGFETMNTKGETIGQILRYIGVDLVRKNPWDVSLRLIPLEKLGRPRIDVVVNICGFFRDTFPNVIKLLDDAFKLVSSQNEPLEKNLVKKNTLEIFDHIKDETDSVELAMKLSNARIFGPSPTKYGTSLRDLINTQLWSSEEDLARSYILDMQYIYTADLHGYKSGKMFKEMLHRVNLTSQIRDSHDYDVTDLDHYYEFSGGLSKAVESVRGEKPEMIIIDTTKEIIKTENIEKAIQRGVRTRCLNPKWIKGMLDEGYNGTQHIQDRIKNILGLAATTNKVDNWIWEEINDRYVLDEKVRKKLEEINPRALSNMIDTLFEANKRGYWNTDEENLERLREIYLDIEGWIEERLE
ncbi:MAG: magnesium chelatase subunit H [Candidatus Methanoliparum thermophilum]|uniref:Magnesium chelatase subunit H n=1 Tax=Methanoliparum thermophilum TaxID=2491083 RepID=A0A520KTA9_METT2|nr:magnesium chelatase subunit H [Candidatus Methanoliparum sp. LAM-1]RZN64692.1 MAG: magnesium chelatase subunit H [Candidatus Methanoliparum thermophilum]BDC36556.1 magnesium chelatase subunit H [Candidatus Methanoliparum sp. LAM-1]